MLILCALYNEYMINLDTVCTIGECKQWGQGVIYINIPEISNHYSTNYISHKGKGIYLFTVSWAELVAQGEKSVIVSLLRLEIHENSCRRQFIKWRLHRTL